MERITHFVRPVKGHYVNIRFLVVLLCGQRTQDGPAVRSPPSRNAASKPFSSYVEHIFYTIFTHSLLFFLACYNGRPPNRGFENPKTSVPAPHSLVIRLSRRDTNLYVLLIKYRPTTTHQYIYVYIHTISMYAYVYSTYFGDTAIFFSRVHVSTCTLCIQMLYAYYIYICIYCRSGISCGMRLRILCPIGMRQSSC